VKTLQGIPKKVLEGSVSINGHQVMAFLADFSETGGTYDAEKIIAAADGHDGHSPPAFIAAKKVYLEELAKVTKCKVSDLIGLRSDGRYWCTHQVAVKLAAWVSTRLEVEFDRLLIAFAKRQMQRACEWIDKRADSKPVVQAFNHMVDTDIDTPLGKEDGIKYGVMHKAIQGAFNAAQGGPKDTKTFKELNGVPAAMDAYDTPFLVGVTLARSVTIANVKRKNLRNLWDAKPEAEDNAKQIAEKIAELLKK
jgi:hypothetical protein